MAVREAVGESVGERILKAGERLRQEGIQQGLEQGLAEGLAQALQRQRDTHRRMLALRFGEVPAWAHARIDAATADELDGMTMRFAMPSSTLDDVLGGSGQTSDPEAPGAVRRRQRRRPT
jgi:hypothetical protein